MENCYSVYKHTFPNGKVYIGITSQAVERRWRNNGTGYLEKKKNGEYGQPLIARAILKYGWDNVIHEVLFCNLSKEEAIKVEQNLIVQYKSDDKRFGYNIQHGGYAGRHSDESKKKISEAHKGKKLSEKHRKKLSEVRKGEGSYWYGKTFPEEIKNKLSEFRKGKKLSEEHKKQISEGMKGRMCSEDTKQKISNANRGKTHSEEHKKKISDVMKKQVLCVETDIIYESISDASEKTGISLSGISAVCNGRRKTSGGYHWKFYNTVEFIAV